MFDKPELEAMLWQRIHRHIPAKVIEAAGEPTIDWRPAPHGQSPVFTFPDHDGDIEVTFAPDDAVLVCYRHNGYIRVDAFKRGERGIVTDWEPKAPTSTRHRGPRPADLPPPWRAREEDVPLEGQGTARGDRHAQPQAVRVPLLDVRPLAPDPHRAASHTPRGLRSCLGTPPAD